MHERPIDPEIPLPIKLDNIIYLQLRNITIRDRLRHLLCIGIQALLQHILIIQLILGNQVVKLVQLDRDEILVGGQPCDFLGRLLDVALQVQLELEAGHGFETGGIGERVYGVRDLAYDGVAPVHEGDFLILGEGGGVGLFEEDVGAVDDLLLPEIELRVLVLLLDVDALARADDGDGNLRGGVDGRVASGDGVDVLLVGGPEGGPVLKDDVLGRPLLEDEFAEGGDGDAATADATYSGHARVVPAVDETGIYDAGELALGHKRLDEGQAREAPVIDMAEVKGLQEPLILGVTIVVLSRTL